MANIVIDAQLIRRALVGIATPPEEELKSYVASFNMWSHAFEIDVNPRRVAMYLAQTLFESNYLRSTEENLNYSADGLLKTFPKYFKTKAEADAYARQPQKIANRVYANRYGNGNEQSGDGWKYRGRGYIQLTFKSNYEAFSKYDLCTVNVVKDPDSVAKYYLNQLAAMWYWNRNNLNYWADRDNVDKTTQLINGGNNGLSGRKLLYNRFSKEYGIKKM